MPAFKWWYLDWVAAAASGLDFWFVLAMIVATATLHFLAHITINNDSIPGARRIAKISVYLATCTWVGFQISASNAAVSPATLLAFSPITGKVEAVGGLVVRPLDGHRMLVADMAARPAWRWSVVFPVSAEDGTTAPPRWRAELQAGGYRHRTDEEDRYVKMAAAQARDQARAYAQARRLEGISLDHQATADLLRNNFMAGRPAQAIAASAQRALSDVNAAIAAVRELPPEEAVLRAIISSRLDATRNTLIALSRQG